VRWWRCIAWQRFCLRVGVHSAFSLVHKTITTNGADSRITEMLRFVVAEVVSAMYLNGNYGAPHI
jgi:hypothetical protein